MYSIMARHLYDLQGDFLESVVLRGVSLIRALVPFISLHPHDPITSQRLPNTIALGLRISTYEFEGGEGTNIQSMVEPKVTKAFQRMTQNLEAIKK